MRLNRTGKRPLAFYGTEIAFATNRKKNSNRWIKVRVYKTDKGGYLVGVAHETCFVDERDQLIAEPLRTNRDVIAFIQREVPELAGAIAIQLGQGGWHNTEEAA